MSEPTFEPDDDEVLQREDSPEPSVLVHSNTPIRVQELPRVAGATFLLRVLARPAQPVRILRADKRRAKATIMSIDTYLQIAFSETAAQDDSKMILWPNNLPFYVTAVTEVWVLAATASTPVGVATELWATGGQ